MSIGPKPPLSPKFLLGARPRQAVRCQSPPFVNDRFGSFNAKLKGFWAAAVPLERVVAQTSLLFGPVSGRIAKKKACFRRLKPFSMEVEESGEMFPGAV